MVNNKNMKEQMNHMNVLIKEKEILQKRLKPSDTGHLHTTINVLKHRIEEIQNGMLDIGADIHHLRKAGL